MKVLSVFNGISCGRVAFERADIPVERYVSYEIDKYANQVAKANYPNDEYNGNVFEADFTQYKGFDILIGGSPCTHWSIAKNGRETTSSGVGWELFMQYVRALRKSECKWFLYENNYSIHKDIKEAITQELGVECIMINSALVSAQQRKRCYWTNIPNVEQPKDKGTLLKNILENGIVAREKSPCIDACYYKGGNYASPKKQSGQRNMVYQFVDYKPHKDSQIVVTDNSVRCQRNDEKHSSIQGTHITLPHAKSQTLNTTHIPMTFEPVGVALRTYPRIPNGEQRVKRAEVRNDEKSNCLTSVQTDSMVCEPIRIGNIDTTAKDKNNQQYRVYSVQGKSICLCGNGGGMGAKTGLYKIDLPDGDYIIRKLTVKECCRLQTLPDNYFLDENGGKIVSDTQAYKGIGNGWTVDVIAHILKRFEVIL